MATILRIFSYYGEPMAEINTAEAGKFKLDTTWPIEKPDFLYEIRKSRKWARVEYIEQKMIESRKG